VNGIVEKEATEEEESIQQFGVGVCYFNKASEKDERCSIVQHSLKTTIQCKLVVNDIYYDK
jgi:hypothetical protein